MKRLKKRLNGILWALAYVFIYGLVTFLVSGAYFLWNYADGSFTVDEILENTINGAFALTVIASVISLWVFMLVGKLRKKPLEEEVGVRKLPPIVYWMSAVLAIGCRFLVTVYYSFSQNIKPLAESIEEAELTTPDIFGAGQILVALFAIVIVAPLFEELLFRVLVMGELKKVMRPWAAITLQAIIFGVAHGVLFQSLFAIVAGVFLGIVYYKTRNIFASALCHSVFNFSAFMMQTELQLNGMIIFSVAGILLCVLSLIYIINTTEVNR